jgi:hypothetical protein
MSVGSRLLVRPSLTRLGGIAAKPALPTFSVREPLVHDLAEEGIDPRGSYSASGTRVMMFLAASRTRAASSATKVTR